MAVGSFPEWGSHKEKEMRHCAQDQLKEWWMSGLLKRSLGGAGYDSNREMSVSLSHGGALFYLTPEDRATSH